MKFSTAAALFFAPSVLAFAPAQPAFRPVTSLKSTEAASETKVSLNYRIALFASCELRLLLWKKKEKTIFTTRSTVECSIPESKLLLHGIVSTR